VRAAFAAAAVALVLAAPARAAPQLVTLGEFSAPTDVAGPSGSGDLYVVERAGRVQLLARGERHLFLDAAETTQAGNEQGMLAIAFHPQYAENGRFFVTQTVEDGDADAGVLALVEYRRDPGDATRSLEGSRRVVLEIAHTKGPEHHGGQLQFGPDGKLWMSVGDGGPQGDPQDDARDPGSPLGKLLVLDPDVPGYEVRGLGLRNPWRFSFDRLTGDLVVGDVGGALREEATFVPAAETGALLDFGWRCVEGTFHHADRCPFPAGMRAPAIEHSHDDGFTGMIGGYVVRDPRVPSLAGRYVYADLSSPRLRAATLPGAADDGELALDASLVTTFGEDGCGRLHVAELAGRVSRLEEEQPSRCADAAPGPAPTPSPTPTPSPSPTLTPAAPPAAEPAAPVAPPCAPRVRRAARVLPLRLRVTSRRDCTLRIAARTGITHFRGRTVTLRAGVAHTLRLWLGPAARRRLRAGRRALHVRVSVTAADGSHTTRRIRLRR
jgi:hypothetical protein